MKEFIQRIQQDSYSESLLELVKRWRIQKWSVEYIKTYKTHALLTLVKRKGLCWFHQGIAKKTSSVLLELSRNRLVEVDTASHTLIRVNGEEVKGVEHNQVLNLSDDGERWEGDVLQNKPYGWGVLYDSENRMAYEGFRIGDVNVCYGTRYYSDIGVIEYKGEWCGGQRRGRGVQYDRSGNTVFDGEWMDDEQLSKRVVLNEENQLLHSCIEELIVGYKSGNGYEWSVLNLSFMSNLRVFKVDEQSFKNVEEVRLNGLNQLEDISIGMHCFTSEWGDNPEYNPKRRFYLKNCKRLGELYIDCYSFSYYSACEIENMPSLEMIGMGNDEECDNFCHASLKLKSDCERQK